MYYSYAVWKATRKTRTPYYIFIHGALDPWFKKHYPLKHLKKTAYWKAFEHKVLRDAESVLFTTNEEMNLADKAFLPYKCRPMVSGYGISRPGVKPTLPKIDAIERVTSLHPELRGRHFLILLARIHVKKGIDLLLHAFSKTKDSLPNTALLIAGPGSPQTIEELKRLASRLGIADDVVWTGPLYGDAKWDALRAADAYVLPSHQENFGISIVEALAGGIPVLISDKVNIWREVKEAGAGLVAPDDLVGTIQLLQEWASLSSDEKSQMAQRAVRCFNQNFDLAVTSERLFEILESHNALPV
jgi:glycosyltransferase involved in cell wall biosynthesis